MKVVYPCILKAEKVGYSVIFPDIAGATQGDDLYDALEMAEAFLTFALVSTEDDGEEIPVATPLEKVQVAEGETVTLIKADTGKYREGLKNARW